MPKAKPKFTKAYSFGLVTGLFFILSWAGQFIFQMISERNEAEQHGQAFTLVGLLSAVLFLNAGELAVRVLATRLASGRVGPVLLLGLVSVEGERRPTGSQD